MSPAPGHEVTIGERTAARVESADTAAFFVAGLSERGPVDEAVLIRSLSNFVSVFGERVSYGVLYDALDVFFREGGSLAYVSRVVGPDPVVATADVPAASGNAFRVDANSPGEWGNDLDLVADATGTDFTLRVDLDSVTVEQSPTLANNDEAVAWAADSDYITLTKLSEGDPVDGTASLATGADDRASITDDEWLAALDRFSKELGPGQVAAPGRTTTNGYGQLLDHAAAKNRRALLDGADTATVATLTAASTGLRTHAGARFGGLFAPWATVPGVAAGTTRTVPYSAVQAGLIARAEGEGHNPNEAAAGPLGVSRFAVGLSQAEWSDADRDTLNDSGVNVARLIREEVKTYGYRTLVNPLTDPNWLSLANSRLIMAVAAACEEVMDSFLFGQIDGKGNKVAEMGGELRGRALLPFYLADALYGSSPEEAFSVNVGSEVNTPESLAANELHALVALRVSPFGERIETEIVKVPTTEAV